MLAAPAAVGSWAFAGGASRSAAVLGPSAEVRARAPRRASNPLEDLADAAKGAIASAGQKVVDATTSAVTGMTEEDRDVLAQKMMEGKMNFDDYMKMTMIMRNSGGVGSALSGLANVASSVGVLQKTLKMADNEDAQKSLKETSEIIGAMTPRQREYPNLLLFSESADAGIVQLSKDSQQPEATVRKFLGDFKNLRFAMMKLGAGIREGKSNDQVTKEIDREFSKQKEQKYLEETAALEQAEKEAEEEAKKKAAPSARKIAQLKKKQKQRGAPKAMKPKKPMRF